MTVNSLMIVYDNRNTAYLLVLTALLCLFVCIAVYLYLQSKWKKKFRAVAEEVKELRPALEETRQQLDEIKEDVLRKEDIRQEFLARMSHEILTPLNALRGMNEMILQESTEEPIKEYARNMKTASDDLLSLLTDVLDFSGEPMEEVSSGKRDVKQLYDATDVLQYEAAKNYLQEDELILSSLKDFHADINRNAEEIERALRKEDYETYGIRVHALKSSARLIGATKLSEDAALLERCADRVMS